VTPTTRPQRSDPDTDRRSSTVVAVPVKDLVDAKQRLVPALGAPERRALAAAMLEDVLVALSAAALDAVWVITRDADVAAIARRFGATVIPEVANRGHTAAVAAAQALARDGGVRIFATIPGDVPCVTAAEVDALVSPLATPPVTLVPSRGGLGTNGVALAPPDVMPLRFGEPSFPDHVGAARGRGLVPRVLHLPGLGLDIDGPDDLQALVEHGSATRSARLLASFHLGSRTA
jgi:2-phospho-L-lactate guanylyltransferase